MGKLMTRRRLRRAIDADRLRQAIADAEAATTGEIRVSLAPLFWGDVRRAAEQAFARLRMTETRDRNGVLFFVAAARRQLVVLGDEGIHAKVADDFWAQVTAEVAGRFREDDFTGGLARGIAMAGGVLATHFPAAPGGHVNQLSDDPEIR